MPSKGSSLSNIDRFFVNSGFVDKWPEASVTVLPRSCSDHRPFVLKCNAFDYGRVSFKCFDSWLEKPGFVDMVLKAYRDAVVSGPPDKILC